MYTIESLIAIDGNNEQYHKMYKILPEDVEQINKVVQLFQGRSEKDEFTLGDRVEVKYPDVIYDDGHAETFVDETFVSICCKPQVSFYTPDSNFFSTSGGDWITRLVSDMKFIDRVTKVIKIWGINGQNKMGGSIHFRIPCKKWEVTIKK